MINGAPINARPINSPPSSIGEISRGKGDVSVMPVKAEAVTFIAFSAGRPLKPLRAAVVSLRASPRYRLVATATVSAEVLAVRSAASSEWTASATLDASASTQLAAFQKQLWAQAAGSAEITSVTAAGTIMNEANGFFWATGTGDVAVLLESSAAHKQFVFGADLDAGVDQIYGAIGWIRGHLMFEPYYRTIEVRTDASTNRMRTFRRQPSEVLPYDIDFSQWLAPLGGDEFESGQITIEDAINGDPTDLTILPLQLLERDSNGMPVPGLRFKAWISGGRDGATYKITARCDTVGGRIKEVDFLLRVIEV